MVPTRRSLRPGALKPERGRSRLVLAARCAGCRWNESHNA
jgi:hypothetical protein